jgi:hypothetical protein
MSGKIVGPDGLPIDFTVNAGFSPEQLAFLVRNTPTIGALPENAEHMSRSQRHIVAAQTMLVKITADNFQLWTMLAKLLDFHMASDRVPGAPPNIEFTQAELAQFADPKRWPSILADPETGNVRIAPAAPDAEEKE